MITLNAPEDLIHLESGVCNSCHEKAEFVIFFGKTEQQGILVKLCRKCACELAAMLLGELCNPLTLMLLNVQFEQVANILQKKEVN